jgi:hypothetical protein
MPFVNTTPSTGCCGMLSNENRVPFHWSLFTIIFWELWGYPGFNKINSVLPDCIDTFVSDILPVFFGQFEFRSELGFIEGLKGLGDLVI